MSFQEMMQIFIDAFKEQSTIPGGKLVSNHRVKLLEQVTETIGPKVLSVDTLEAAIKEVEFETENGTPVVAIADLYYELEERGIKCK